MQYTLSTHTNANIWLLSRAIDWDLGDSLNPLLNLISDMGHHLNGLAQIVATSLLVLKGISIYWALAVHMRWYLTMTSL